MRWLVGGLFLIGCAAKAKIGPPPVGPAPARQVTQAEKAEFGRAVANWRKVSDNGSLSAANCAAVSNAFAEVADDNPKLVEARYDQGAVLERCGNSKGAEQAYQQALGVNPNHSLSLAGIGRLLLRQGDEGRAYEYFDRAAKSDSKNNAAYLGLAQVLHERAKRGDAQAAKDARNHLRRALAVDAYNMDAYATLALLEYDLAGDEPEKLDMARLVTEQARKLDDRYAPIHNTAGLIALKRNNVTSALASFKRAAELDPNLLAAHLNIGSITLNFRDYTTAAESFRHVLKFEPKNFDALMGLGVALRGLRQPAEAEKQYLEAGKANPDDPAVLYNLGVLYQDYLEQTNAQLNKAKEYLARFAARSKDKARVEDATHRIKNIDDTFRALEEAKKMQVEMERMQKAMEEQQRKMREEEEARKKAEPASVPAPSSP